MKELRMFGLNGRLVSVLSVVTLGLLLGGCGSTSLNRAPVEDRVSGAGKQAATTEPVTPAVKPPPGFENAGKPGYYTVKPGETLIRIGLDHGQSHKDIARWSGVENANKIEVGQVLRVIPPVVAAPVLATSGAVAKPVSMSSVSPVAGSPLPAAAASAAASAAAPAKPASAATAPASSSAASVVSGSEDDIAWIWPTSGAVLAGFDEVKNKGLDIGGANGDPVVAAADGRVVYVGAGLRGYGNLIILKHNNTYLTAYAHNKTLLIKEDQAVRKGQKIAEMGNSDADRVKLHFEVRRQGKPVDPAKYLPAR
jgi:lipoprotein NlpD